MSAVIIQITAFAFMITIIGLLLISFIGTAGLIIYIGLIFLFFLGVILYFIFRKSINNKKGKWNSCVDKWDAWLSKIQKKNEKITKKNLQKFTNQPTD